MDNSVKALYEARKIELKLAQRKMLGIVTPATLSVEAIHRSLKSSLNLTQKIKILTQITQIVNYVANPMIRESVLHTAKCVTIVAIKITLNQSVLLYQTQIGQRNLSFLESVASVTIRRWIVLNTVKNQMSQIQTQKESRI